MVFEKVGVIRLTPLVTQVTHPFLYPTRMRNRKRVFLKHKCKFYNKNFFSKKIKIIPFRDQTFTLGCVTCVLFIGGFLL